MYFINGLSHEHKHEGKWRLVIKPYNLNTYGLRAFSVIAPILWNDLPIDIRSIDDVNKFKSKLKTFLFKRVYELS